MHRELYVLVPTGPTAEAANLGMDDRISTCAVVLFGTRANDSPGLSIRNKQGGGDMYDRFGEVLKQIEQSSAVRVGDTE